jgi:hypothetical protein
MIFFPRKKLFVNNEYIVDQQNKKIIENCLTEYLSKGNPTKELLKNLSDKGYSYKNFSPEELEKIVLLFLHKNSPKEIEDIMSHLRKPALQTNLSDIFVDNYDPFIFMLDSPTFYKNLINNLDDYKKYNGKIKEIFDLLFGWFRKKLKGEDYIKFISYLNDDELDNFFETLHKNNVGTRITIDNLFQLINTKENAPASYFERLINAFVTNRNTNDKEIAILERFIEQYNKNNPRDPIKPVDFNDLRMKNIIKRRPSVKDSLIAIGVSFLASITNKFKLK